MLDAARTLGAPAECDARGERGEENIPSPHACVDACVGGGSIGPQPVNGPACMDGGSQRSSASQRSSNEPYRGPGVYI